MTFAEALMQEFDQEMPTTRKLLERVPFEHATWKPHPKSFALGHLAQLVSWMPGWITNALTTTELDLSKAGSYSFEKTETLLDVFDKNVTEARAAIAAAKESDFDVKWSLTRSGQVLLSAPRRTIARQTMNHLAHHRGQLTVYLRMKDVALPPIYGPTADERW